MVTNTDQWEGLARKEAWKWASRLLRDIVRKDDRDWEGELRAVIPMHTTMHGFKYKFCLDDVPEEMLEMCIIPGLRANNHKVKRVEADENILQKKKSEERKMQMRQRVADIGDAGALKSTIDKLQELRGDSGAEEKRRRFADAAMSVLLTSVTVGAARMEDAEQSRQIQ